tara:strand:+ start:474 stop:1184 length:711 start_codon:yes stop_codon:yes gene_type:complete
MIYKGLIHFHSKYSYDSILSIKSIVNFAIKRDLNFLILTDHDTIKGSQKLREYIKKKGHNIEVIIAAEYCTEYGDIIALDIKEEINDMKFNKFISSVRSQGGYILFPHPYVGHKNINKIAEHSDLIEVFNSRTNDKKNDESEKLAETYSKNIYFASDAHNKNSLKNAIVEFEKDGNIIDSLLKNKITLKSPQKTFLYEIYLSQIIKSIKHKNLKLFVRIFLSSIKNLILLRLIKRV